MTRKAPATFKPEPLVRVRVISGIVDVVHAEGMRFTNQWSSIPESDARRVLGESNWLELSEDATDG